MTWNSDTDYALGLCRMLAKPIGIWPLDYKSIPSKIRVLFFVFAQVWLCVDLILQFLAKGNCATIAEIADMLSWIIVGLFTSIKLTYLVTYQQNMHGILSTAVADWSKIMDPKTRHIMLRFARIGRIGSIMQVASSYSVGALQVTRCIPAMIAPLNHGSNLTVPLCIPLWPACWVPEHVLDYTINYINQTILIIIIVTFYAGCESLFFGTAMHLTGQFEELHRNPKYLDGAGNSVQQVYQLIQFVKRHRHLLMLANDFEETYNIIILVHVAIDIAIPCASGILLLISLQSADYVTVGAMIVRICLAYLQLYVYSYVGEQLNSQTEKLQSAIYNSPWYNMSSEPVKDIIFVMMRCNYPFNLTAGKIYNMNIPNFTGIIKTISSYFSVIRLMITDNDS